MGALHDGAHHLARPAALDGDRHHGRIADAEQRGSPQHGRERLRVAASGADVEVNALFLEVAGRLPDIEVDVAEVVHGLHEVHLGGGAG